MAKTVGVHDPGKIVLDLAIWVARDGDCLAVIGLFRPSRACSGRWPRTRPCPGCSRPWLGGPGPAVMALRAGQETSHTELQAGIRVSSDGAWADHGGDGTCEPLVVMLRPGTAGSTTADDHTDLLVAALAQLPFQPRYRLGRKLLVRDDSGWGTRESVQYCQRRLQYSVTFTLSQTTAGAVDRIPEHVSTPAYDAGGTVRDGAWVAELTGLIDLTGWPPGMCIIVRAGRPHPARGCGSPTATGCG